MSSGTYQWDHTKVFANGELLATYKGTETYFALNDWLGTKRVEATPDGSLATYSSLPWGNGLAVSGTIPDATAQHFTGKERDTESGNDYFGARYYASTMGRFMSPDWSGGASAVPYADFSDPQSLNLYSYVRNNPLSRRDPDGHLGCGFLWLSNCPEPPPPPAPPAPKPPAVVTPGTPQNNLANAQDAARADPKLQPTPPGPGRTTFCNIATCQIVQATGTTTDALGKLCTSPKSIASLDKVEVGWRLRCVKLLLPVRRALKSMPGRAAGKSSWG